MKAHQDTTGTGERQQDHELRRAMRGADLRILVVVLAQLTGDRRWFAKRFRPAPDTNLVADPSAGLSDGAQREVREAAFHAIHELRKNSVQLTPPSDAELVELMSLCAAEPVPLEYAPLMMEHLGFMPADARWHAESVHAGLQSFHVLIVGAGVSGLCAAIKLNELGVPFTVIEKNPTVGGTWLENDYPECGVDTPNHLYSYSFAPKHDWPSYFVKRDGLYGYLEECSHNLGIRSHIRFGTTVTTAIYDDERQLWRVELQTPDGDGDTIEANVLITAVGQLNQPKYPDIPGLASFGGPCLHSARWRRDVNLDGARVAVVGTGASAMQLVRTTARRAGQLLVFQRSPQWAAPVPSYYQEVSPGKQWLLANVPLYEEWWRFWLFWKWSDGVHPQLQADPTWEHPERSMNAANDQVRELLTDYIRSQVGERTDLLPKLIPDYPPYGKRMLIDNDWFATMTRRNVQLITEAIVEITSDAVVIESGERHEVDVIILATGFQSTKLLGSLEVRGRHGRSLRDAWGEDDARAYLGITVPGFPNLFCLYGPNTNLAHGGSIIFHSECQVRYVTKCITRMIEQDIGSLECRQDVHDAYNEQVDQAHARMVWTHPGMTNWYKNRKGRVVNNSPWRLVDYWHLTLEPKLDDYLIEARAQLEPVR